MSKIEKIVKSSIENLTGRGILNQKKIDSSKLTNILLYEIVDDLKWDEVSASYLNRYSTVRLVSMIKNLIEEYNEKCFDLFEINEDMIIDVEEV